MNTTILNKTFLSLVMAGALAACSSDADIASRNLSEAADNFEVNRRVAFYNSATGDYLLMIEGLCSRGNNDTERKISITCKVGPGTYKKHYLGLSDNVTYIIEQLDPLPVSTYHYTVVFKPSSIAPTIQVK